MMVEIYCWLSAPEAPQDSFHHEFGVEARWFVLSSGVIFDSPGARAGGKIT
jgi:hypothetical protein